MSKDIINRDENGELHGYQEHYWDGGYLYSKYYYHHGTYHGPYERYCDNILMDKGVYHHGILKGYWYGKVTKYKNYYIR